MAQFFLKKLAKISFYLTWPKIKGRNVVKNNISKALKNALHCALQKSFPLIGKAT